MKIKNRINVIIFVSVSLIIISAVVCILLKKHNYRYPEKYISQHYPSAEIISVNETGDIILNPYKKTYTCLDKEHNFVFYQNFRKKGSFLKLDYADKDENNNLYNEVLKKSDALNECAALAQKKIRGNCFTIINPDNSTGFIIIMEKSDFPLMLETAPDLDEIVKEEYHNSGIYIRYIAIACDKILFDILEKSEEKPFNSLESTAGVSEIIKTFSGMEAEHIGTYDEAEFTEDDSENTVFAINGENNHTGSHKVMSYRVS